MSTKQQRDEWQRLSDAATAGPWSLGTYDDGDGQCHFAKYPNGNDSSMQTLGDAMFIAAAREAVPALLQDVAALTAERDAVVATIERYSSEINVLCRQRDEAIVHGAAITELSVRGRDELLIELANARSERDVSNLKREEQWKELQAARADAAAMRGMLRCVICGSQARVHCKDCGPICGTHSEEWQCSKCYGCCAPLTDAGRTLLVEVVRLREENAALTDVVNAGPTKWAYDQACAALHKQRERADSAEAGMTELERQFRSGERAIAGVQKDTRDAISRADRAEAALRIAAVSSSRIVGHDIKRLRCEVCGMSSDDVAVRVHEEHCPFVVVDAHAAVEALRQGPR